ncbi:MAG: universal stress protein [Bdellovibrionota bacterium]
MSAKEDIFPIRRVLVALDPLGESEAVLESALDLASRLGAELVGLFIEDESLLHLAGFPFVRQFDPRTGAERPVESGELERALRSRASRARGEFEVRCEGENVKWSCRVLRGEVGPEVAQAPGKADILVLGKTSRAIPSKTGLGSTARLAIERAASPVLLVEEAARVLPPVTTVYDGSQASLRAVQTALQMAEPGWPLTVLASGRSAKECGRLEKQIAPILAKAPQRAALRLVAGTSTASLVEAIRESAARTLVVGHGGLLAKDLASDGLLERLGCTVLLVR